MSTYRTRVDHVPVVLALALACAALLAGCGAAPPLSPSPDANAPILESVPARPTPMIEHPPMEPVEPSESIPAEIPHRVDVPVPAQPGPPASTPTTPSVALPPSLAPVAPPEVPSEEQQVAVLLADLARYAGLSADDIRRELSGAAQALTRQRTDANRVRLALLYMFTHSQQDDQRALQLLESVARSTQGTPGVKQLAGVLQAQLIERVRAVREEQQKAEAALQKLDALRVMERSLLRDRVRSGSGGAAGGSGGGSGGR